MRLLRLLYIVPLRLRSLLRRARVEQDLDDEIHDHLERRVEAELARGLSRDAARDAALRAFGGVEQRKEECRDMRHVTFFDHRAQDLRFAMRQLRRHPAFAVTAIAVFTLGIAGSVAIFGFVDAGLIRPLPYREPSRLVTIFPARPDIAPRQQRGSVSYLNLVDWRDWSTRSRSIESIAAYDVRAGFTMVTPSGPQRVTGLRVTSGFFRTLGVAPIIGREFAAHEEGLTAPAAVMLSYSAWQSRFGGSPEVLGRTVTLQSPWLAAAEPHVIVGVLPQNFHFTLAEHAEFWATIRGRQACWNVRTCQSLEAIARLAPGSTVPTAAGEATSMIAELRRQHSGDRSEEEIAKIVALSDVMLGNVRPVLLMLLGGAGLLLVIACVNVVSLLLARSDARAREIGVRQALGASSSRVLGQFATEAVVLTVMGTLSGLVLAHWTISLLTGLLSANMISRMPYLQTAALNGRVLAFAAMVSLAAAALFAIAPAARIPVVRGASTLHNNARGFAGTRWRRLGAPLVVVELAVAMVLLAGAGLLSKSLYRLLTVDTGFNAHGLAAISVTPVSLKDAAGDAKANQPGDLARRIAARVAALPGVESTGYADQLPLGAALAPTSSFWVTGRTPADQIKGAWPVRRVSAAYLQTLETRLLRGRYFTEEEVSSVAPVMVINESAARQYFPDEDPIGRSIAFGSAASPRREIVGVIGDIKDGPPETPAHPSAYVPFDNVTFAIVIRMPRADRTFSAAVVQAIREIAPDALVGSRISTMRERVDRLPTTSLNRSLAWLVGGFAAIAFVLSIVGLYGVVAYSVGQRTREIGVRMALGAPSGSVSRLVLGEASRVIAVGAALGLIGGVVAASILSGLLFEVRSWDPQTLAVAAVALIVPALAASYLPARRAAAVNPIEVLRGE